uniref:SAM domain-containing protein n=1 Tax=Glossina palpalis gambiensis TaxID=67801 RepID=A0A1B0BX51_9MUSC
MSQTHNLCKSLSAPLTPNCDVNNTTNSSPFLTPLAQSTPSTIEINIGNNLVFDKCLTLNMVNAVQVNKNNARKTQSACRKSNTSNISRRALSGKKNSTDTRAAVQKILEKLGLSKYSYHFRFVDIDKFLTLKELDLVAIGITRRQDINKIIEAIKEITRLS